MKNMVFSLLLNVSSMKSQCEQGILMSMSHWMEAASEVKVWKLRFSFFFLFFGKTLEQFAKAWQIRQIVKAATVVSSGKVVLYMKTVSAYEHLLRLISFIKS